MKIIKDIFKEDKIMKPIIRVNHAERKIELNKEYFRRIQNPKSEE